MYIFQIKIFILRDNKIQLIWLIEENLIIFLIDVWFKPLIEPTMADNKMNNKKKL